MRKLWSYNAQAKAISDSNDVLVMYSDDMNEQLLQEITNMWNGNEDLKQIQKVLDNSELCTTEEGDYVMEQIGIYQDNTKHEVVIETKESNMAIIGDGKHNPGNEEVIVDITDKIYPKKMSDKEAKEMSDKLLQIKQPIVKKERKQRQAITVNSSGKLLSGEEMIKQLRSQQEKTQRLIAMVEWIDQTTIPLEEFPDGLHKEAIELLIKFGKDIAKLKSEYIAKVQEL